MRIAIGSAGRRVYLIRWFQEAMSEAGLDGQVYVFENNRNAASVAVADEFVSMPRYEHPEYRKSMLAAIDSIRPDLFISLNDHELVRLAGGLAEEIRSRGVVVPALSSEAHDVVADKLKMAEFLNENGIDSPKTILLSEVNKVQELLDDSSQFVIKDRFGSGSSGLQVISRAALQHWITLGWNEPEHLLPTRRKPHCTVVQPKLEGVEFGVDVVTPLWGGPVEAILARRKLAMRGGETNVAETVAPSNFETLGKEVAGLLQPQGLIDMDVIQTRDGKHHVIDVNPRFGGGYPFSHTAGVNVPGFYIASLIGTHIGDGWKNYRVGHRAAKFEETVVF